MVNYFLSPTIYFDILVLGNQFIIVFYINCTVTYLILNLFYLHIYSSNIYA